MEEKIDFEAKYNKIKELYNDLNNKYAQAEEQLIEFSKKPVPKFEIGDNLFVVNLSKKDIERLKVDEIVANRFGIAYREFVSEVELKQFPEMLCFKQDSEAQNYLDNI